jgi:hypothetical protein
MMPIIKRVLNSKSRSCDKCRKEIPVDVVAIKDRKDNKKRFRTRYYHVECA